MVNQKNSTICLVQITRIGDLLQTEMVAAGIKQQHPGISIHLVARKQFAEPIIHRLQKTFDMCHLIDIDSILPEGKTTPLKNATKSLKRTIDNISTSKIDVCINLSFSKVSSYLCSLIKSEHKMGPWYDNSNLINIEDKWSKHIYSSVMGGALNPFSLIDLYAGIVGISKLPTVSICNQKKRQIVIHPFASGHKKLWSITKWIDIIYTLLKQNSSWKIIIVGSSAEVQQSKSILKSQIIHRVKDRIINLTGSATIQEVEDIISESSLFIGNDSMVGHLAARQGTKTITISLGPVRPIETAPYGEGNIVMTPRLGCFPCQISTKCELLPCHSKISYQAVSSTAQAIIDGNDVTMESLLKYTSNYNLDAVKIYTTRFTNQNKLFLDEITHNSNDTKEVFQILYRICWNFFFDETEENVGSPEINTETANDLKHYLTGLQHLYDLCEFGKKYSKFILEDISCTPPKIEQIKNHSANIDEIDKLQAIVKQTFPLLSPIVDYFQTCKSSLPGETLVEITEHSYITFNDYETVISIVHELIEKILTQYEIQSNRQSNSSDPGVNI